MRITDHAIGTHGARLSAPLTAEAQIEQGFLLEVLRYPSTTAKRAEPAAAPRVLPTAREAVRTIRVQIRTAHVFGMTPHEIERALAWAERGWMQAIGLLKAGQPCGFTVVLGSGAVAEWAVRPLRCLTLSPRCTRAAR